MADDFQFAFDRLGVPEPVPLYRLQRTDPEGAVHRFYTASAQERSQAVALHGYEPEGVACRLLDRAAPGTAPLFRLWHAPSGQHSFTLRLDDLRDALAQPGYRCEGVMAHAFATDRHPGTVPLWALHHRPTNAHLYTAAVEERDAALAAGFDPLGVACWVFPAAGSADEGA
jgi:hypothetical protein